MGPEDRLSREQRCRSRTCRSHTPELSLRRPTGWEVTSCVSRAIRLASLNSPAHRVLDAPVSPGLGEVIAPGTFVGRSPHRSNRETSGHCPDRAHLVHAAQRWHVRLEAITVPRLRDSPAQSPTTLLHLRFASSANALPPGGSWRDARSSAHCPPRHSGTSMFHVKPRRVSGEPLSRAGPALLGFSWESLQRCAHSCQSVPRETRFSSGSLLLAPGSAAGSPEVRLLRPRAGQPGRPSSRLASWNAQPGLLPVICLGALALPPSCACSARRRDGPTYFPLARARCHTRSNVSRSTSLIRNWGFCAISSGAGTGAVPSTVDSDSFSPSAQTK